jgi:uncharacterized membrane protein YhaH (DUF805 family)
MSVINSRFGKSGGGKTNLQAAKTGFHKNTGADFSGTVLELMAEFKHMKRWAALTVLLYAIALLALTVPAIWIAFNGWSDKGVSLQNALKMYLRWGYWLWLAVLVAGQALLLLLPINIVERRLPARRPLKTPVIVTAFFLANLCFAGLLSILCLYDKEDGFNFFGYFLPFKASQVSPSDFQTEFGAVITGLAFWIIWAVIFRSFAKSDDPDSLLKRSTRWLLRGSILELLVAVPSHIIVRRRGDCCAPIGTFWGIATGISVMLLCFGPGVFFLFVERFKRLQPKSPETGPPPAGK